MCPRSFLCEEARIKQRTSSKKQFCEIGEEAISQSRFTSFCFLTEEAMTLWKKNSRYYRQSTQNSLKRREMWFLAGVRMTCVRACVCAYARVCPIFNVSNLDNS